MAANPPCRPLSAKPGRRGAPAAMRGHHPACRPLFEKHGRRNDLAVTNGHQPHCRPLSVNPGRRDAPAAMRGRQPCLLATFREAWPARRFGSHGWPATPLSATFNEPWPARRTSGHAWPPPRLLATFRGTWPAKRFSGHEWPPTPFAGHFQRTLAGETPQRPCVAANPACRPLSEKHGRRNDLAVADGRQPPLPATFSEPWPARRFGDHAWPATRPRGDEETRRSGRCRDRRGRGGRDPQAAMPLGDWRDRSNATMAATLGSGLAMGCERVLECAGRSPWATWRSHPCCRIGDGAA